MSKERWARDSSAKACLACEKQFSVTTRRHHCRSCGEIFCDSCSNYQYQVPISSVLNKERVCVYCARVLDEVNRQHQDADKKTKDFQDNFKAFRYQIGMCSDLEPKLRTYMYATKAANILRDLEGKKRIILSSAQANGSLASPFNRRSSVVFESDSPLNREESSLGGSPHESRTQQDVFAPELPELGGTVLYDAAWERQALSEEYEDLYRHSIDLGHIIQRKSLLNFFHSLRGHLVSFFACHKIFGFTALKKSAQPTVELHGKAWSLHSPNIAKALFGRLSESADTFTQAKELVDEMERCAARITRRYEEQICTLTEDSATLLATSAFSRILARCESMYEESAKEVAGSSGALNDFFYSAMLANIGVNPVNLETLLPEVDTNWTDHAALALCGLRTPEGDHFDPKFTSDHEHVGQFYYRQGTLAEARAFKLRGTGKVRQLPSPIKTVREGGDEYRYLVTVRDQVYATYSLSKFSRFDERGGWGSEGNKKPWIRETQIAVVALQRLHDYYAGDPLGLFVSFLRKQFRAAATRLAAIDTDIERLRRRFDDINQGPHTSIETMAYIDTMRNEEARDPSLPDKKVVMEKYKALTQRSSNEPAFVLYARFRLKLTSVLLVSTFQDVSRENTVLLMGYPVTFDEKVAAYVNRVVSHQQRTSTYHYWSTADIVESHAERFALAAAERFAEPMSRLTQNGVMIFAECLVARLLGFIQKDLDGAMRVAAVRSLGTKVDLEKDTIAQISTVHLPLRDPSGGTLREYGIHTKAGLKTKEGKTYAGPASREQHHRGVKYGFLLTDQREVDEKQLSLCDETWTVPEAPQSKGFLQRLFSKQSAKAAPLMITQGTAVKKDELCWRESTVSAGPRNIGAGETVGVSVQPRTGGKDPIECTSNISVKVLSQTAEGNEGEAGPLSQNYICTSSGAVVIAAVYEKELILANEINVKPSVIDRNRCTVTVDPLNIVAGQQATTRVELRDTFGNMTTSTNPDDILVSIFNEDVEIVPDRIALGNDGSFAFNFSPVSAGGIRLVVTVGGALLETKQALECLAGLPDFKRSDIVLDLDEIDTATAGNDVRGILYLYDEFKNPVEQDDEHPLITLINGGTTELSLEPVEGGGYMFDFTPTRQGTAVLKATSQKSGDTYVRTFGVQSPHGIDWQKSLLGCLSPSLRAGEEATFHITAKDQFGNLVSNGYSISQFEAEVIAMDGSGRLETSPMAGMLPHLQFSCVPKKAGSIYGQVKFDGKAKETGEIVVQSAAMSWDQSSLIVDESFVVAGELAHVQIKCRDAFGNDASAHPTDFTVSVHCENQPAKIVNTGVIGAGSFHGFQFISYKAGSAVASVAYAGRSTRTCEISVVPAPFMWSYSSLRIEQQEVVAGEPVVAVLEYYDHYENATHAPKSDTVQVSLVKASGEMKNDDGELVHSFVSSAQSLSPNEARHCYPMLTQEVPTLTGEQKQIQSKVVFSYMPTKADRYQVQAVVSALSLVHKADEGKQKNSEDLVVVPASTCWKRSLLKCSQSTAVAGRALVACVKVFDRFGNPTRIDHTGFLFSVVNEPMRTSESPTSPRDEPVVVEHEILAEGKAQTNVMEFRFTPERAGRLIVTAKAVDEKLTASCIDDSDALIKEVQCPVVNSDIDWKAKTQIEYPELVTAGEEFEVSIRLRDAYDNVVSHQGEAFELLVENQHAEQQVVDFVACEEETSTLTAKCTVLISGQVSLTPRFQDEARAPTICRVRPALYYWPKTEISLEASRFEAGLDAVASLVFFDRFGNKAESRPDCSTVKASVKCEDPDLEARAELLESKDIIRLIATPTVSTNELQFSAVLLDGSDTDIVSPVAEVSPTVFRWANTEIHLEEDALGAGDLGLVHLRFRDKFHNYAPGPRSADEITLQGLEASTASETSPSIEIDSTDPSRWRVTFIPVTHGQFCLQIGHAELESLKVPFTVVSGSPHWPLGCELQTDSSITAGSDLVCTLQLKDKFGNATERGATVQQMNATYLTGDCDTMPCDDWIKLPDASGSFIVTLNPTVAGKLQITVSLEGQDQVLTIPPVVIKPGPLSWQNCRLTMPHPRGVVDAETQIIVSFQDSYRNTIPLVIPDEMDYLTPEDTEEVRAVAQNLVSATVISESANSEIVPSSWDGRMGVINFTATRIGSHKITLKHAEFSGEEHLFCADVVAAGIRSAEAKILCEQSTLMKAAQPQLVKFELWDRHMNPIELDSCEEISVDAHINTLAGESRILKGIQIRKAEGEGTSNVYSLEVTPMLIGTLNVTLQTTSTPHVVLAKFSNTVTHGVIYPAQCTFAVHDERFREENRPEDAFNRQCKAGGSFYMKLTLRDEGGNLVTDLPDGWRDKENYTLSSLNGTATPYVEFTEMNQGQGIAYVQVTPVQLGSLQMYLSHQTISGRAESPAVTVLSAGLHWQSCSVKFMDTEVSLGESTDLIIQLRDSFKNKVKAKIPDFKIEVEIEGYEGKIEVEELRESKGSIQGDIKALSRGRLKCNVTYVGETGEHDVKTCFTTVV